MAGRETGSLSSCYSTTRAATLDTPGAAVPCEALAAPSAFTCGHCVASQRAGGLSLFRPCLEPPRRASERAPGRPSWESTRSSSPSEAPSAPLPCHHRFVSANFLRSPTEVTRCTAPRKPPEHGSTDASVFNDKLLMSLSTPRFTSVLFTSPHYGEGPRGTRG